MHPFKKTAFSILFILCTSFAGLGQSARQFETLDRFFAGVPLRAGFEKWYDYIAGNAYLGIDSTTRRGNHSSLKAGIESYYPFPDSMKVKILFKKTIMIDFTSKLVYDSISVIEIQGVFGETRTDKKESKKFYRGVRKELMRFYRYEFRDYYDQSSWFYKGKTSNFPNCSLHFGYHKNSGGHYVLLAYSDQKNVKMKSYPAPDNILRN